jgi:hypothetical protein
VVLQPEVVSRDRESPRRFDPALPPKWEGGAPAYPDSVALARALGVFGNPDPGLAHRRPKHRRGPGDRRARDSLEGAGDVVCRAGHDLSLPSVEVEDDHGAVIGEHVRARADLVDLSAPVHLSQQVHRLARCKPIAVFPHTC